MGRVLQLLIASLILVFSVDALAGPVCPSGQSVINWKYDSVSDRYRQCSPGSVVIDPFSCFRQTAVWDSEYPWHAVATITPASGPIGSCIASANQSCSFTANVSIYYTSTKSGFDDHTVNTTSTLIAIPVCSSPSACQVLSADGKTHYFSNATISSGCNPDNSCAIALDPSGSNLAGAFDSTGIASYFSGSYTGSFCAESIPVLVEHDGQPLPDGTTGVCNGASSSTSACITQDKANCGYVNGEYRCVTAAQLTDENPCVQTSSGAVFCKADAPSQPLAPTNADGTKKPADTTFHLKSPDGTSTTVNYYGSSTVTNGAGNPGSDSGGDEAGKGDCGSKNTPCHVVVDTGGTADGSGGGGDGDDSSGPFVAPSGNYGFEDESADVTAARQAISDKIAAIKSEVSAMFGGSQQGAGELTCDQVETQTVGIVSICPKDQQENVSWLAALILLGAWISAAVIILR